MTLRKRLLNAATTVMLACTHASAQQLQASLSHYSTDDGLASNAIAQIIQDDYGYIWLATWNGLSRFDGYEFYNYRTGNASHIPHLHNRIMSMLTDLQQNVWLKMYDGRVFVLSRLKDRIINPFSDVSGSEAYHASIPLFRMSNGDILAFFPGIGMYKMKLDRSGEPTLDLITTSDFTLTSIAEGYHDDIWVGTERGLHRIDIGNLSIERQGLFDHEHVTALFSNGYNVFVGCASGAIYVYSYGQEPDQLRQATGDGIQSIFVDSRGLIWFADDRFGATRLNGLTHDEKHFEQRVPVPEHDGNGGDFRETGGTVWVRMNHGGYGYYNRQTDEVEYFHNDPSNPWNLSNTVNASAELPEGVVFLSTSRHGLEKLEILKNNITRTLLVPNAESTIDNEIRGIFYDPKRHLLLMGNKNNTLFVTRSDGSRTLFTHDQKGNPIGRTYGIAMDSKNNYWISSKDNGLFRMTPNADGTFSLQNFRHDDNDPYSLSSNGAYQAVEDSKGNIWVATYGGGVNVLTRNREGRLVFLHPKNEMRQYPRGAYMKVRTIATDRDGRVWAGTTDGILLMSLDGGKVSTEKMENSKEEPDSILMSTDIVCLARSPQGDMWVGTNGGGLCHATRKDSQGTWLFESFGSRDGLPSEEIKSIAFDLNGNVWFATDHIICSYNTSKKIFTTFSSLDGVDETMCSEGAAITLPDGKILFGTLNGYYIVDRQKLITNNASMLKLRITDFFLNDELVSPNLNSYYDYYVPDAKSVTLPEDDASFAFRFASMNYQLQHRIHYQYMLEGYDREWQNAGRNRMAAYASLPAGIYTFKVKAFLLESPDKYDIKTIEVIVPSHFLLSPQAIWLYVLLALVAGVALALWWRRRKAQQRLSAQKQGSDGVVFAHEADFTFMRGQMDWMEANFANPNLKIDDLAAQSGLSRTDYNERLKLVTGLTPREFITDFRIKKAIALLENTTDTVAEVAEKTGFDDPVAFTRTFMQAMGTTPSKYREQQKAKNQPEPPTEEA